MATIRLRPFATALTAPGTSTGLLTMGSTSGITRNACLTIAAAGGGWRVQVDRVISATALLARLIGFDEVRVFNKKDLSALPNGADVLLEEQWVPDLYSDDVPLDLAIPVK